ncbi:MAG: YabP/YqfC family sporulation protein [Oscillospiraceae bacterium]|nr:YabP/YqfC family sporulation protein [Oscillospiraceae bacterium]
MGEDRMQLPHKLTLSERRQLSMTGVTEVVSFDENAVVLHTELGLLTIHGKDLQLKTPSLDGGQVAVDGTVTALVYEEPKPSGGWLRRLLG